MVEVAVISDDLTGGNAVGAEFAKYAHSVSVFNGLGLVAELARDRDVLVVNTETRNVTADEAANRCEAAAQRLLSVSPQIVIKKIDSLLRGHLAMEIDIVARTFGFDRTLVVPAAPSVGRTTVDGIQFVDGIRLEDALRAADPSAKSKGSEVSSFFEGHVSQPVHRMEISDFDNDDRALIEKFDSFGNGLIISDAITDFHVERIVKAAYSSGIRFFVGSYGIGGPLASIVGETRREPRIIIVSGSLSSHSSSQIDAIVSESQCTHVAMDVRYGMTLDDKKTIVEIARDGVVKAAAEGRDVVLTTSVDSISTAEARTGQSPAAISSMERMLASLILSATRPLLEQAAGIIVSGGSTANALLDELGAESLSLHDKEVLPGMPLCTISGGPHDGLFFLTKPGSFGSASALIDARKVLKRFITKSGSAQR